jgi:hypothetical protein
MVAERSQHCGYENFLFLKYTEQVYYNHVTKYHYKPLYDRPTCADVSRDSSVGIATGYGLEVRVPVG